MASAQVALDCLLYDAIALLSHGDGAHGDVAVGAFASTVVAAYAVFVDLDFAIGVTSDGTGRASDHALGIAAMPTRRWNEQMLVLFRL